MQEMTSLQQIEYISREAAKLGIKYGEWVRLYGHTLPKPKPTPRREIGIYAGIEHKKPKKRDVHVEYELKCENEDCGKMFKAGKKDARFCPDCIAERKRVYNRQYKKDKKAGIR
jgi:hypothetical protein